MGPFQATMSSRRESACMIDRSYKLLKGDCVRPLCDLDVGARSGIHGETHANLIVL